MEYAENNSGLYFPIAGTEGIKSSFTPDFKGDSKIDQNTFLMEPVSAENLHDNKSGRNFWCRVEGRGAWSAMGASAEAENDKWTSGQDYSKLSAGYMWQKVVRESAEYQLRAEITAFVPLGRNEEVLYIRIRNMSGTDQEITPIGVVPIYGRSAENIRDHRHVTSLLHRICTDEYGVKVKPTMSFDERGHQKNDWTYYVCGVTTGGEKPEAFYPDTEMFLGEGGSFAHPGAVYNGSGAVKSGYREAGREAVGGIEFSRVTLAPGEERGYVLISGLSKQAVDCAEAVRNYGSEKKLLEYFARTRSYWEESVNISYHTGNPEFDHYMRWVNFQPVLRRIYGCSFLPHHDYGKGGRGWRDLWQDCLALLMMDPGSVRKMILNHFAGVRMDGTNATIIGEQPGEFIADRNHIARVWMDHAFWPFLTVRLYLDQTGDFSILDEKVPYFKDQQIMRGQEKDEEWNDHHGTQQMDRNGRVYEGSVLEHLLIQNLCAFYEVGEHNHMRLRGADWNDALDLAPERGESVAFTCAYVWNFQMMTECLQAYGKRTQKTGVLLLEEVQKLLMDGAVDYEDVAEKNMFLKKYGISCMCQISGIQRKTAVADLIDGLRRRADWMTAHIRKTEWVGTENAHWYNGYYDNHGRQVEGSADGKVRMMLTSQVFSIMSGIADDQQVREICRSADRFLFTPEIGGYRLNTDFDEVKMDLGRMFGFAYGTKENGAVFSHMTVMYANALYQRGFVREGHLALQTLMNAAMNFEKSRIYPGIPEYFDGRGRGMYHYLTGAASWYMLTMVTQVFGIHGEYGNMVISPKLMAEEFDRQQKAEITLSFADRKFRITICNPELAEYGTYQTVQCLLNYEETGMQEDGRIVMKKEQLQMLSKDSVHQIVVMLKKTDAGEKITK
jgi:cellobiose phosphorylase